MNKIPFGATDEYFAVDYHSTDGTVEYFKSHHIPVVIQEKKGRGEAFYLSAKKAKGKYLVFFSPDGNEDPSDIPLLIRELKQSADMVIASRFMQNARNEEDGQVFKFRAWANRAFTLLANLLFRGKLTDSINGYRAIKKEAFEKLKLDAQGYAVEYQMSIRALKLGLKIKEIPTIEGKRIGGTSGAEAIPTGIKFLYYLIREILIEKKFI